MKANEAIAWFDEISQRAIRRRTREGVLTVTDQRIYDYDHREAVQWITDAESALRSVFPPGHTIIRRWEALLGGDVSSNVYQWSSDGVVDAARAIFEAARSQLKAGRVAGLMDAIKAETAGELLDQADALMASGYLAASMVIAGGALESFLRHLCERNAVQWRGSGSITAYEVALGQARNAGTEIISATDGKLVTGWGGMRNEAAHNPGQFGRSSNEVGMIIMHIRDFVARHT